MRPRRESIAKQCHLGSGIGSVDLHVYSHPCKESGFLSAHGFFVVLFNTSPTQRPSNPRVLWACRWGCQTMPDVYSKVRVNGVFFSSLFLFCFVSRPIFLAFFSHLPVFISFQFCSLSPFSFSSSVFTISFLFFSFSGVDSLLTFLFIYLFVFPS
ncbi:hypothetical protein L228DRAFT_58725 [Xylona heveae TC161]|uniref:Transmembrane protein n=1 Tax=Xylona heveae (strain CBS 132557 / TC161) TaxID=1328760 RepID=A0A165II73_XYLHT|nr:hypothetical protein L228DRAFT_58725 [Xylona heveae TC161]KZF24935.1 hypothetical protein L228DRAFT_58725 [Xylona heveae TC161]